VPFHPRWSTSPASWNSSARSASPSPAPAAGYAVALLCVILLAANIYAATADIPFAGEPASPLWQRMPEQILYIAAALWATRGALPLPGLRHPAGAPRAERA